MAKVKYFIKAPITGWREVDEDHYNRFKNHLLAHSNPQHCTPAELAERLTRKEAANNG